MIATKQSRNATPPLTTNPDEHCECSRCGTIYPTFYYQRHCPGCDKRRTYKDIIYRTNPFRK